MMLNEDTFNQQKPIAFQMDVIYDKMDLLTDAINNALANGASQSQVQSKVDEYKNLNHEFVNLGKKLKAIRESSGTSSHETT